MIRSLKPALAVGLLLAATPALAALGHAFTNKTTAGLRCRLSTETSNTAMTIQLEPMETVTVMGQYRDIRCDEPVVRQRFAIADGGSYVFHRNRDGNTISLRPN